LVRPVAEAGGIDCKQVMQALEKLSIIEGIELAKALSRHLYADWNTILSAIIDTAKKCSGMEAGIEEKTVIEETVTEH